jgi:hypothetical protein
VWAQAEAAKIKQQTTKPPPVSKISGFLFWGKFSSWNTVIAII